MSASIVIHNSPSGRWFRVDGVIYDLTYGGRDWGWAIHSPSGVVIADGYMTLDEVRADARRAVTA